MNKGAKRVNSLTLLSSLTQTYKEIHEKCCGNKGRQASVSIAFSSSSKLSRVFLLKLDYELEISIARYLTRAQLIQIF